RAHHAGAGAGWLHPALRAHRAHHPPHGAAALGSGAADEHPACRAAATDGASSARGIRGARGEPVATLRTWRAAGGGSGGRRSLVRRAGGVRPADPVHAEVRSVDPGAPARDAGRARVRAENGAERITPGRRERGRAELASAVGASRPQCPPAVPGGPDEPGGGQEADAEGDQQDLTQCAVGRGVVTGDGVQQAHDRTVVAHRGGLWRGRGRLRLGAGDLRLLLRSLVHGLGLDDGLGGLLRGSLLRGRLLRSLLGGSVLGRTGLGLGLHLHGGPGLLLDRGSELLLGHVLLCALLGLQFLGRGRLLFGLLRGRGCLVTGSRATRAGVVLLVVLGALVSVALVVAVLVVAGVFGSVIGVVVIAFVAFALVVVLAWSTVVRGRLLAALTLCSGGRSLVASVGVALLRFVVLRVARRGRGVRWGAGGRRIGGRRWGSGRRRVRGLRSGDGGGRRLVASVGVALLRFVVLRVARRGRGLRWGAGRRRIVGRRRCAGRRRIVGRRRCAGRRRIVGRRRCVGRRRLLGRRRGLGGAGLGVGRLRGRRRRGARGLLGRRLAVAAGLRRRRRPLCRRPFRRHLLGATLLGAVLDGHDLSRLDRRILGILDRPLVLDQRGCIVRHRGHLVGGLPLALDAAGTVPVGGIGQCGKSGGRERDGESGGTCAEART